MTHSAVSVRGSATTCDACLHQICLAERIRCCIWLAGHHSSACTVQHTYTEMQASPLVIVRSSTAAVKSWVADFCPCTAVYYR